LSRWDHGQFANFTTRQGLSEDSVIALYEDGAHSLWIGTDGGGLNRYKDGAFTAYTTRQGLFSDEIFEILEDDHGWLWMTCSKGISRVRKKDLDALGRGEIKGLASEAFGKSDGMESPMCNGVAKPAAWKTRDGRLWFPTTKGLAVIGPDPEINLTPPPVFLEQVFADRMAVAGIELPATGDLPLASRSSPRVRVPPGRGEFEFHFTALQFQAPEKCLFKYMLEGVDSDWVEAGPHRVAHYNNIYPGNYRFRVIACNNDGVWNEQGVSLAILLLPHYWQTWWFRALGVLLILGAVSGAARYATQKRMQRRVELLVQQHAIETERARIAKDIHDDLGSSLTRIMMLGERAQEDLARHEEAGAHVGKIVTFARATVQSLDEIVWAVNPENDTLEGLIGYISQYANQFFEGTSLRCRLEMPVALPAFPLPAEIRHGLFLVVKEALNNVLKHSRASEVHVKVSPTASTVEITIADDGCGFDPAVVLDGRAAKADLARGEVDLVSTAARRKGNGLENMRQRMAGLGGRLDIVSALGKGTIITFTMRLQAERD
jgi:signal transduction histidine kinase